VGDRETVVARWLAQLSFWHHLIAREAKHMVHVEPTWQSRLDQTKYCQDRKHRSRAHNGGEQKPMPTKIPIAAVVHIDAAVVRPRTVSPSFKITPAPRKPMPVIIPCAIRVGSVRMASI